jgi:hypothetical protein
MNEQLRSLLERRETTLSEMAEHSKIMRRHLEQSNSEWVTELEKYYGAKDALLQGDKELAVVLRNLESAA